MVEAENVLRACSCWHVCGPGDVTSRNVRPLSVRTPSGHKRTHATRNKGPLIKLVKHVSLVCAKAAIYRPRAANHPHLLAAFLRVDAVAQVLPASTGCTYLTPLLKITRGLNFETVQRRKTRGTVLNNTFHCFRVNSTTIKPRDGVTKTRKSA